MHRKIYQLVSCLAENFDNEGRMISLDVWPPLKDAYNWVKQRFYSVRELERAKKENDELRQRNEQLDNNVVICAKN